MQYTAIAAQTAAAAPSQTTLKVSRTIQFEMVNEFQKFGFTSMFQYTDYILSNRHKIMDHSTTNPAPLLPPPQPDFNQNFGQTAIPQKQQGMYISHENSENLQELWRKNAKAEKALQEAQENLKKAFRVIEQLIDEASEHSGKLFGHYDREYYENKTIEFLQKEGLNIQ